MLTVIERARRYIAKCPPAISGQRGHDANGHVAAVLWNGFGLSEAIALRFSSASLQGWARCWLYSPVRPKETP